ncbi:hypothetical protein Q7P37_005394 [Cladosporium fusiforme]
MPSIWVKLATYAILALPTASSPLDLGNQEWQLGPYSLALESNDLRISDGNDAIWSSGSSWPFISASIGDDIVSSADGAFNITNVDEYQCQDQNITSINLAPRANATLSTSVKVSGHLLDCGSTSAAYTLTLWLPEDLSSRVAFDIKVENTSQPDVHLNKLFLRLPSTAFEGIYGLGAQASFGSLKNQTVPVFTREQGVGRGDEPITSLQNEGGGFHGGNTFTTYTANPSYITTNGHFFYLNEEYTGYSTFDFKHPEFIEVRYDSLSIEGAFGKGGDMFKAVEKLTEYTGRMPALPRWVDNGAILGIQGGKEKVKKILQQGLNLSCPIAGVWLQDWEGIHEQPGPYINISRLWWNWESDKELYPAWPEFVQGLRDHYNVRPPGYVNTFLTNVSSKASGYDRNLYDEAEALGYFVRNTTINNTAVISSGPGLEAGIIDIANPDLQKWFAEIMRDQVWNANISGFMTDFGEYTPITSDVSFYGMVRNAFYSHNRYPYLWAKFQRGVVDELGLESEALLFHRSASMGSARYTNLFWVGDQNVYWGVNDGLKSAVTSQVHMGLSGYAQLHSDIGGYTTTLTYDDYNLTRSAELLGRWGEMAAVSSSVFRSHEGNIPAVNAQFYSNESSYQWYAYNARMFVSLGPYRRHVLETESETKGWPLLRSPVMYHSEDLRTRKIKFESFYLGAHLYVAPVVDPDVDELEVYLPGDQERSFTHVWTGVRYHSGQDVKVPAPFGQPAVFLVDDAADCVPELQTFLEFVDKEKHLSIRL